MDLLLLFYAERQLKCKVKSCISEYFITMCIIFFISQGGVSPLLYWEETRNSLPQLSNPEPEHKVTPVPAMPEAPEENLKLKLCRMEKTAAGYGFHLNGIQGVHGQYIKEVRENLRNASEFSLYQTQLSMFKKVHAYYDILTGGERWSSRQSWARG